MLSGGRQMLRVKSWLPRSLPHAIYLVNFGRFVNDLSAPNFGTYNGTDHDQRQIQFALKLLW